MTASKTRPDLTVERVAEIADRSFGLNVVSVKPLGGYIDQNFLVETEHGAYRLLKAHSRAERDGVLDLQNAALQHLQSKALDFVVPQPFETRDGNLIAAEEKDGVADRVRCLSFVEGSLLADHASLKPATLERAGQVIAGLDSALADFEHPGAARPDMDWDLRNAPRISKQVHDIPDPALRRLADYFFLQYASEIEPKLSSLPMQVSHNDGHRYSLIAGEGEDGIDVTGVIDFGDIVLTHAVCHLAVVISDLIVGQEDLIEAASFVVRGYNKCRSLSDEEIDILYHLVGTRLAIYAAMAGRALKIDPSNTHPQSKLADVHGLLRRLVAINPIRWTDAMRRACGLNSRQTERAEAGDAKIAARSRHFSPSLYTHYQTPIVLDRAAFQYFYDQEGRTYLDCVNNVCQWGHCHPSIVRAAQAQMARLNTNSRYVYDQMAAFAGRLTATMPDGLDTVFFVNSGSEANDLAARLARAYTGHNDFVVVDRAYHGNSSLSTELSPNRIDRPGRPGLPPHVRKTECPDLYRGKFREDDPRAAAKYVEDLRRVVSEMVAAGSPPAAFFAESLVGTGGQIVFPEGYLQSVYEAVRGAGGICVADEVQVGFGRTGDQMWCFETQNVVPDIVTMGKPIANGHPMAAVVTRRDIAEAFDNGITYFNTFGGNPVSCAIGLATMDVLQSEDLMANTSRIGGMVMDELMALQQRHSLIGDVRGLGLYIGVELVDDPQARTPATKRAKAIVEAMKLRGVLLNTNGYDANILKIKPPLLIDERDVDQLITTLDEAITATASQSVAA